MTILAATWYTPHHTLTLKSIRNSNIADQNESRVNDDIRARQVRLIGIDDEGGNVNMGVVNTDKALELARERGLDLVEVAPNADPPVCKIMDYGKYLYSKKKREREARKQQKQIEYKEIQLHPKTDDHHIEIKVRNARRWLGDGMKVKVRVKFKGREITYPEIGRDMLVSVAAQLEDIAMIEQSANMDGRSMLMILAPASDKSKKS